MTVPQRHDDRIDQLFSTVAQAHPTRVAVVEGATAVTYGQLLRTAEQVTRALAAAGVTPGQLVGLRLRRGWRVVAAVLGVWRHGCGYVPIDPQHPAARQQAVVDEVRLAYVVEDADSGFRVRRLPRHADGDVAHPPDTAYVLFTSGSTGRPKGVVIRHPNLRSLFEATRTRFAFGPRDVWSQFHSPTFDFQVWEVWGPLLTGGTCAIVPDPARADARRLADFLASRHVTVLNLVPSVFRWLTDALADRPASLPDLRHVILGGEAVTADVVDRWWEGGHAPGAALHNMYGITEVTVHATLASLDRAVRSEPGAPVPIGRPLSHTRIVLAEEGKPVPPGVPGEIHVSGDGVAWGYLGRPELTRERFVTADLDGAPRRWYRSGDYAVRRADGTLVYTGRRDEQVKVRGVRLELGEIERALTRHPAVDRAFVTPVDAGPERGLELVAAVSPAADAPRPTAGELRRWVGGQLPAEYVPRAVRWLDSVPLGPNGKVDRRLLAAQAERWWRSVHQPAPSDPRDGDGNGDGDGDAPEVVRQLWRRTFPDAADPDHEGFVSLGGNSLLAVRLLARVREETGVDIPLSRLLVDDVTVAELCAAVAAAGPRPARPPRPDRPSPTPPTSPLSPHQRRMWVLDRLLPEAAGYNVVGALRVPGPLSTDAARAALAAVVARHDALRARLVEESVERPRWRYLPAAEVAARVRLEVETGPDRLDEERIVAFTRRLAARPLRLDSPPPLTAAVLVAASGTESCLALSLHHIVADQVSLDLVLDDVARGYTAALAGAEPDLGPAPSFARHAVEAAREVDGPRWRADLAYWRRTLADAPTEVALPFRGRTPAVPSLRGRSRRTSLGSTLSRRVTRLLRSRSVTAATLFLSLVSVVLSAWTGQSTVVLGMPAVRRRTAADGETVGFLLSTLPVRVDLGADPADTTFAQVLDQVRARCVAALEHDTPSFDAIVEALGTPTDPSRNPVFNVWVNDVSGSAEEFRLGDLTARRVALPAQSALFELNFYLHRDADGLALELVHRVGRVPDAVAEELLEQCVTALHQVTRDVHLPLAGLSLVTPRARARGAVLDAPLPRVPRRAADPTALVERFATVARSRRDAPAVVFPGGQWSYAQLADRVAALARRLTAAGVRPADVVEVRAARTAQLPLALLAVWRAGGVAALVDATLPELRQRALSRRVAARWVLGVPRDPAQDPEVTAVRETGRRLPGASHVLFTSGSGGEPAAVVVPPEALAATLDAYAEAFAPDHRDRVPLLSGLGHDPVLRDMLVPLYAGGVSVVPEENLLADPPAVAAFLRRQRVTVWHTTPALCELTLAAADGRRLDALRLVVLGGGTLTAGLVRRLRALSSATVVNAYGTTETPQLATWRTVRDEELPEDEEALPVAAASANAALLVVTEAGAPAGIGQRGEVVVRGRHLATGYLDDGDGDGFVPDPGGVPGVRAFRTGDLGRLDPSGAVHLAGRRDRQVQLHGFRVELAEVETAARRCPGVRQAAATLADTPVGEVLSLYVVPAEGGSVEPEALRAQLRRHLPAHAVPARIHVVPALGTNANHKPVAPATPPGDTSGEGPSTAGVAGAGDGTPAHTAAVGGAGSAVPASPHRREADEVLSTVTRVLGTLLHRTVGPEENFFDAGLNSISLLRLREWLQRELAVSLPAADLFAHPNARALARRLAVPGGPPRDPRPADPGLLAGGHPREVRRRVRAWMRRGPADGSGQR